jgi:hypothetical protein
MGPESGREPAAGERAPWRCVSPQGERCRSGRASFRRDPRTIERVRRPILCRSADRESGVEPRAGAQRRAWPAELTAPKPVLSKIVSTHG